jgi:uncharacterized repeat protein (TIGR03943 family)
MRRFGQIPDWPFVAINAIAIIYLVGSGLHKYLIKPGNLVFSLTICIIALISCVLVITTPIAHNHHNHYQPIWRKLMVIIPLLLFVIFGTTKVMPTKITESSRYTPLPITSKLPQIMKPSDNTLEYNHIDWQISISDDARAVLIDGKPFRLEGYISIDDGKYMLSRIIMTHCISCSMVTELDLEIPEKINPPEKGQWIEAQGKVRVQKVDGIYTITLIPDKITPINEPEEPYLTP